MCMQVPTKARRKKSREVLSCLVWVLGTELAFYYCACAHVCMCMGGVSLRWVDSLKLCELVRVSFLFYCVCPRLGDRLFGLWVILLGHLSFWFFFLIDSKSFICYTEFQGVWITAIVHMVGFKFTNLLFLEIPHHSLLLLSWSSFFLVIMGRLMNHF